MATRRNQDKLLASVRSRTPTFVFAKQHVELPMTIVFNRPMLANGFRKIFSGEILTQNVVTYLFGHFIALLTDADHPADGCHRGPFSEHRFTSWNGGHVVVTLLLAVSLLFAGVKMFASSFRPVAVLPMVIKKRFDGSLQLGLIAFDSDRKLALLVDDFRSDRSLTTHRVDRNRRTFNVDLVQ